MVGRKSKTADWVVDPAKVGARREGTWRGYADHCVGIGECLAQGIFALFLRHHHDFDLRKVAPQACNKLQLNLYL